MADGQDLLKAPQTKSSAPEDGTTRDLESDHGDMKRRTIFPEIMNWPRSSTLMPQIMSSTWSSTLISPAAGVVSMPHSFVPRRILK